MKILLLGANGQLGHELKHKLPSVGNVKVCTRADVDLTNKASIITAIDTFQPDVIVNAAAYTTVDKAESEQELAFQINSNAVTILAQKAAERGIWLIHYSTDYVFDGSKQSPYTEADAPNPLNVYGESKLAGENAIKASGCHFLIFRTTWVIGEQGHNFARTILRVAKERDTLNIVHDQFGVPTAPKLIAKVTHAAIEMLSNKTPWPSGIYHLTPNGQTTWYDIAQTLLQIAEKHQLALSANNNSLHPIQTKNYPTPAKRPKNSLLNTSKLEQLLNFDLPHWKDDFSIVANTIIKEFRQHET